MTHLHTKMLIYLFLIIISLPHITLLINYTYIQAFMHYVPLECLVILFSPHNHMTVACSGWPGS